MSHPTSTRQQRGDVPSYMQTDSALNTGSIIYSTCRVPSLFSTTCSRVEGYMLTGGIPRLKRKGWSGKEKKNKGREPDGEERTQHVRVQFSGLVRRSEVEPHRGSTHWYSKGSFLYGAGFHGRGCCGEGGP